MTTSGQGHGVIVVGAGYWGVNYVRVLSELPEVAHIVVCETRQERLEEIGVRFPAVTLTTDLEVALAEPRTDSVILCTPATQHYEAARRCLEAGKHLLVEKPITARVKEATDLIEQAEDANVTLGVGHTFMYNPALQRVEEYLREGAAGRLYYMYARRTNLGPIRTDVNALWDLAPHDISIFNYLLDDRPEWVSAVGHKVLGNGRHDVGFVVLQYADDIVAHLHISWADPYKVREVVVVGSDARIVFDDLRSSEPVRVYEKGVTSAPDAGDGFGEFRLEMRDGDIISPRIDVSEPLKNQTRHFLECVRFGKRPITDGHAGRDVVAVMEAIDHSIRLNGAPVEVSESRRVAGTDGRTR